MTQPVGNMRLMTDHTGATSPTRQFAPLAIILGLPLLFAAIFFYTSPVVLETGGEQGIFKCGSPSSPNSDAKNVCGVPEKAQRLQAVYSGLSGVALVGLGSVWLFRGGHRDEDEWDEDEPRRGRGRDIDLREDPDDERPGRSGRSGLRSGIAGRRERGDRDEDEIPPRRGRSAREDDFSETDDVPESRASRRRSRGRRPDPEDDLAGPPSRRRADDESRRRADDDWSSDGWR